MPTNLKSLLTRSRSRNELKSRGDVSPEAGSSSGGKECESSTCKGAESLLHAGGGSFDQFRRCDTTLVPGIGGSCSHLVSTSSSFYSNGQNSPEKAGNDFGFGTKNPSVDLLEYSNGAMRKCETVVTLSTFSGNTPNYSPDNSPPFNFANGSSGEKAKIMKNKILSTSSSTLSCLFHSSSRSKLFSGWKLSPPSAATTSNNPNFDRREFATMNGSSKVCGSNDTTDAEQIFKSQLSVSENGIAMTPLNRLRRNVSINNTFYSGGPISSHSRSSLASLASFGWKEHDDDFSPSSSSTSEILCRLCLCNVKVEETEDIASCGCRYCKDCVMAYISFEIKEGAEEVACPDASCEKQGVFSLQEIELHVSPALMEKHKKFRLYRDVEKDGHLMWCPHPGCETVCRIQESESNLDVRVDGKHKSQEVPVNKSLTISCTTCRNSFCAECKLSCHSGVSCEVHRRKMIKQGKLSMDDEELFSTDCIKKCPFCYVPIYKDSGCAQMMCKKCKHVFCWYCLASLDDDFLLRHFDKGPCKNKLGHSRASVVWHRAQVIGIFTGFGILVLLASPLIILAAPCLLCFGGRCHYCSKEPAEESPVSV